MRNKAIRDAVKGATALRVSIHDNFIQVEVERAGQDTAKMENSAILQFPRKALLESRMAAGGTGSIQKLFDGARVSFDKSMDQGLGIERLHQDLTDIYTLVSLFSGAGILDWPFFNHPAFCIQYAIDYNKDACQTYRHNIGAHIVHGDIHKAFTPQGDLRERNISSCDIVVGGPSCKPFSASNRSTRLEDHPDGNLVMEYMRIVETLAPKVFAIENVPSIITASGGRYYEAIAEYANKLGYSIDHRVVEDNEVGGYTTRRRVFIIGSRGGNAKAHVIRSARRQLYLYATRTPDRE